jgi:hypothetical protein
MDDCLQLVGLLVLSIFLLVGMAVVLTWEPKGARWPDTCPYCVAVARTKPAVGHCWRCGGRYDKGRYSLDWDAMNLELFRSYHGKNPEGFVGDPESPSRESRPPEPPDDGYRKDRHD